MTLNEHNHLRDDELVALVDGTSPVGAHVLHLDRCDRCRETLALARAAAPSSAPEHLYVGRYEIRSFLGEGGMGVVYRAWDPDIRREVALKVWRSASPRARDKLLHEARVMGRLTHPGLATVHDAGHDERFGTFIAVGLVTGETLRQWLRRPTSWKERLKVLDAVAVAVAVAHDAGVAHGDLKPENILVRADGTPVVTDFGLALVDGEGPRGGTPGYAAPEQLVAGASPHGDQYSLCVLAGELSLPRRFDSIWARGRRTDPQLRWADMHALVAAIRHRRNRTRNVWLVASAATMTLATFAALPGDSSQCILEPDAVATRWRAIRETVPLRDPERESLDEYVTRWLRTAEQGCEEHRAEPCLLRTSAELQALLELLQSGANPDTIPWVASLPAPEACFAPTTPPAPAAALVDARSLRLQGHPREAARLAGRIALQTDEPALAAEAELLRGKTLVGVDDSEAHDSLWRATVSASSLDRPDLEAEGLLGLAMLELRTARNPESAARMVDRAASLVARHQLPLEPAVAFLEGSVSHARGERAAALTAFARADALAEAQLPEGHPFRLQYAFEHGLALARLNRYGEAVRLLEALTRRAHRQLGSTHPLTALLDVELGAQLANTGQWHQAQERIEPALADLEAALGGDAPAVLDARRSLALVSEELGLYDIARSLHLELHRRNERIGRKGEAFGSLCSLGDVEFESRAFERAAEQYAEALAYAALHTLPETGGCLARLGAAKARLQHPDAGEILERALAALDEPGADVLDSAFARLELARIEDDPQRARARVVEALERLPAEGAVARRHRDAIVAWLDDHEL